MPSNVLESVLVVAILMFIGILIYSKVTKQSIKETVKEMVESLKDAFGGEKVVKK